MFFPLHVYTGYSFLRSGMTLSSYVALCAKRGQKYCAASDFETMTGFPELASLCRVNGMSPVYAMDVSAEGITLTLVVASEEGYRNLIALGLACGNAPLEREFLYAHIDGLLPILDMGSPKLLELSEQGFAPFAEFLDGFTRRLGTAYLGLPYLPARGTYVAFLREFVQQYPYPLIAHPHVRYAKPGDAIALSIVEAIANDGTLKDKSLSGDQYFLEEEVLNSYYAEEELAAPEQLIQSIQFKFSQKRGELPHYPTPNGEPSNVVLRRAARLGLERKVPNPSKTYIDRLEYELGVIEKMGYCDYFLIVADYVRYAKTHGISVGPGRGSGAGSLVSFSLGIVTPDPIKYGLLFERFLNPERQSMPDIDVDFADVRRDEVAYYLQEKYGHSRVAHIVTMQTLGAKASIRDVGRVFGYEPRHIDMLAKAIGPNLDSLRRNYLNNARFRTLIDSDPYYLEIVTLASRRRLRRAIRDEPPRGTRLPQDGLAGFEQPHPRRPLPRPHRDAHREATRLRQDPLRGPAGHRLDRLGEDHGFIPTRIPWHEAGHRDRLPHRLHRRGRRHRLVPPRPDGEHPELRPQETRPRTHRLSLAPIRALPQRNLWHLGLPRADHADRHRFSRL